MGKVYTRFQTKQNQKPYPLGRTYLYGLYKGGPPGEMYTRGHIASSTKFIKTNYFKPFRIE